MVNLFINFYVFCFGACIGSFLNVVIYRLPAKISLIYPPSRCPHCLHPLGKTENVPVLGWLWLRGKCRWCQTPVSPRYPLIEALTGFLFLFVYHQFGISWLSLGYFMFLSWLMALAWIDLDTMTLPNSLTRSGLILGLIWQFWLGLSQGNLSGGINFLFQAILGAVVGIWIFDAIVIIGSLAFGKQAMGDGDPKLAAMIGAWLGWQNVLLTGFLACCFGSVIGVIVVILKLKNTGQPVTIGNIRKGIREQKIPFGPFLVLGALSTMFAGEWLLYTYLDYIGW